MWDALLRGEDLVSEIPADRWDADSYYDHRAGVPDRSVSRWGGFLDDVAGFDPEFFGIGEQRGGRAGSAASFAAGSVVGGGGARGSGAQVADRLTGGRVRRTVPLRLRIPRRRRRCPRPDVHGFTGSAASLASGRIAHTLGLRGPALTVDTAGSSSLLAVHLACRSLHDGESDLALAGGCMVMLEPRTSTSMSGRGMLSPTGRCRTFDVGADGYVRSEACAMVLLKRLPDAQHDGDRIVAVLRGTAANQEASSESFATPSKGARRPGRGVPVGIGRGGVDADTVGLVEADGAGNPVGDSIEFASLAQVYGAAGNDCVLGSVKSNAGHTDSAAGAVALIKAILSVRHGVVPPMLHFTRLPDDLARIETGLVVPEQTAPWPATDTNPRRAAVSSYGLSGTNVHAILEQAPDTDDPEDPATEAATPGPLLFTLSSTSGGTGCARRRADSPIGWRTVRIRWPCPTWPTPWRGDVATGRCAPRWSPAISPS